MTVSFCIEQRCPNTAEPKSLRCTDHKRQHVNTWNKEQRDPVLMSFYQSKEWKTARARKLSDCPVCPCGQATSQVHHIVKLADGGTRTDQGNLAALCASCHAKESARERQQKKDRGALP